MFVTAAPPPPPPAKKYVVVKAAEPKKEEPKIVYVKAEPKKVEPKVVYVKVEEPAKVAPAAKKVIILKSAPVKAMGGKKSGGHLKPAPSKSPSPSPTSPPPAPPTVSLLSRVVLWLVACPEWASSALGAVVSMAVKIS